MSEQNISTVRAIWDAVNRGDLDAAMRRLPDDFVADWSASVAPESGVYSGRENIRGVFEGVGEAWSDVEYFEDEIIDRGDHVVRVGGMRARGKGSGAEVAARGTQVWTFRGDMPISVRLVQSKDEALESLGPSE